MSSNYKIIKSGRSLDLAYQLGAMTRRDCHVALLLTMTAILFSFNAQAECTPAPDCASIGYTETSCDGDFIKCPFDTSKLHCTPCDSKYKYTCSGANVVKGIGESCNGLYVDCECPSSDYILQDNDCVCDTSCSVGAIYYSDGMCSSCVDNTKIAVGIVVKDNELISSLNIPFQIGANSGGDIATIPSIRDKELVKADMNGKLNTAEIVSYYGADVDVNTNAAVHCYKYAPVGMESSQTKWYLPSAGEMYTYFHSGYNKINKSWEKLGVQLSSRCFWTSSEFSHDTAWYACVESGAFYGYYKTSLKSSVVCLLEI